ncbi:Nuclear pore complex protein [Forsythia ovata]|uniref:Nuclear pore complex protein n=1 Tax=Forsythia ovata TaxID=205694 RepID=A0ABD1X7H8_9LAMI
MATAGEGGATANTAATASSYEGGGGEGVGGKFRKRPFRRAHHTTPYDRPLTAVRGITTAATNSNNSSWLTKLVVDPASKLISYGAHRFFASVFRKRLPPPPQPPESNNESSDGLQEAIPNNQSGANEPAGAISSHPVNRSDIGGISELEQLLKQKTFTRPEIERLTELLRSRAEEVPVGKQTEEALLELASDLGRHQQFSSSPLEEDRNERDGSHGVITTIVNSRVLEDDIASPAELAKAYMGGAPSKVSSSKLGMRSQIGREDARLLSNAPFTSKSPVMSLTTRAAVNAGVPQNGFITPRSRGRSAIYNMARTPYPRVRPTSIQKGSGSTNNGYGGPSLSKSQSLLEHDVSKQVSLKRRSSILDDDLGAGSPMRRIRQKPNLLSPRIPHSTGGGGIGFDGVRGPWKQKLPLVDEPKHKVLITVRKNEDDSIPSTSYTRVPSKSTEVASRILQHLEMISPKEKSSEPKLVAMREKTPAKLTPNMLHGQALRSMEDVESSKLLQDVHDAHKLDDWPIVTLPDAHEFTSQIKGRVEPTGPKDFVIPPDMSTPAVNNDTTGSLKASGASVEAVDSVAKNFAAQPPQRKQAFRMSAQEDFFEQDDDIHCNGVEPKPFDEGRVTIETSLMDSKPPPTEEPNLDQTTSLSEEKSVPDPRSSKRSDVGSVNTVSKGEASTGSAFSASQATGTASQSAVLLQPVSAFDKPNEDNDSHPLFSFSSTTVNEVPSSAFPSSPFESSSKRPFTWSESKPENSSSLVNATSAATGAQLAISGSDKDGHLNSGGTNGKSETAITVASNGPLFPSSPAFSSTAASISVSNQISTGSSSPFTSSTIIANFDTTGSTTSTSAASTSSVFGSTVAPSFSAVPAFKFVSSVDPSPTAVSPASASTATILESKEAEKDTNFGSSSNSNSSTTSIMAASSGSSTFQLGSSVNSTANTLSQGSLFGSGTGSLVSGTVTQSMPISFGSSLPSSSITINTPFASSSTNSQVLSPNVNFGFSSAAFSSETKAVGPGSGPIASVFKFGVSSAASSDVGAINSSSGATPGIFSFGLGSSSSATNVVGSTSGATPSVFGFGGSSAASTSGINAASSFSSGTSGIFSFGATSSASSSAINSVSSSNPTTNLFGSSWQSPKSPIIGSPFTSPSPSSGFSFGASSSSFAATNTAPMVFNSSTVASSNPIFSFTTASAAALSSTSLSHTQPVFGNPAAFAASPGNDQMNAEDSMAEDTMQSSAPSVPVFGQPTVSPSTPGFMFGSTVPSQPNPFLFAGQQNQVAPQNPTPFQASASLEFNAGGSFSLGSGGGDKAGRKYVKVNRSKNRKK